MNNVSSLELCSVTEITVCRYRLRKLRERLGVYMFFVSLMLFIQSKNNDHFPRLAGWCSTLAQGC